MCYDLSMTIKMSSTNCVSNIYIFSFAEFFEGVDLGFEN